MNKIFLSKIYFRQNICCGVIYLGQCGEVMIDQRFYKKCQHHSPSPHSPPTLSPATDQPIHLPESPKSLEMLEDEENKSFDEDSDAISFYSDDTESDRMSKLSKEDFGAVIDTDGDEGFYDKSETRRLVQ